MTKKLICLFFISIFFIYFCNGQINGQAEGAAGDENIQSPPVFKIKVDQIRVPFLATEKGKIVHGLTEENIRVYINIKGENKTNWQEQEIINFLRYAERPIAAFINIDLSDSVEGVLDNEIKSADKFLSSLLRFPLENPENQKDKAGVGSFMYRRQVIETIRPPGSYQFIKKREGNMIIPSFGEKYYLVDIGINENKIILIYDKELSKPGNKLIPLAPLVVREENYVVNINGTEYYPIDAFAVANMIILILPEEVTMLPEDVIGIKFIPTKNLDEYLDIKEMQKLNVYVIEMFKLHQAWTSDIKKLQDGLVTVEDPGGGTNLFDSLFWMAEKFDELGDDFTKIGVVITDGCDTASAKTRQVVIEKLLSSGVILYTVSLFDPMFECKAHLKFFSEQTGGKMFIETDPKKFDKSFNEILEEVRGVYTLSIEAPPLTGKYYLRIEAGEYDKRGRWKRNKKYLIRHPKIIIL